MAMQPHGSIPQALLARLKLPPSSWSHV